MKGYVTRKFLLQFIAGAGMIAILGAVLLPALSRSREASRRASCQNNLKQMGLVFKMFANESKGEVYPPLSPHRDNWMVDATALYPEYLTDLEILVCPSSPFRTAVA
ncbi:MAG: DUF1559 domain-containing protein, partial [Candidatus Hydrogenedentes bacterium]|nr:DUF1559 domain-containing protein [Candidatus Hydrogenedentota bacterium]